MLKGHKGELRKEHSVMETRLLSVLPAQGAVKACQSARLPRTTHPRECGGRCGQKYEKSSERWFK